MAAVYGRVQGNRSEATRGGSKASGIRTVAETWKSIVNVSLLHDGECRVYATDKHGNNSVTLWEGNTDSLVSVTS
jgi:hypothetical protein